MAGPREIHRRLADRVRLQGLRVIDSSIIPRIIGGNTMAPTIMIAEKGADMFRQDIKGTT